MTVNLWTIVGIGLAAMFLGYFFGLFEGRQQGAKKRKQEEEAAAEEPAAAPAAPEPVPEDKQRQVLMELSQSEAGGTVLEIDGDEVDARLISPEKRRRLIDLMVMLKPWVGAGDAAVVKPPAVIKAPAAAATKPLSGETPLAKGPARGKPAVPAAVQTPAIAQLSLVAQIDTILQARLAGTQLADRGIRLAEALHGGAIVFVGSTQYDGVDKVPDPEIQSAIRAAIAEWENTYTPG
jgi:hypothetical protein